MQWLWDKRKWIGSSICFLILGSSVYFYNIENQTREQPLAFTEEGQTEQGEPAQAEPTVEDKQKPQEVQPDAASLIVDIKGAVASPGVYTLDADARVYQAIGMAGGLLPEADAKQVNGAQKLADGMMIYIPLKGETLTQTEGASTGSTSGGGMLIAGAQEKEATKINLNTATAEQLQTIPGIGPRKAEAIIQYREENGPFKTVEGLTNIAGIGAKTVEKMRDKIFVQ
ncbi:ComEA family DNA-binding protein [Aneurinibacillus sp. BA2021]|nr:ComEA family DNA-binding protein [Aneurinibacillus sp. BA2021]